MPEMSYPTLSRDVFKYWIIDRIGGEIRIYLQDGNVIRGPLNGADAALSSQVLVSVFDWEKWWVESITTQGHFIISEAYSPEPTVPLHGRKTVYLDQNHWSLVGAALTNPDRVSNKLEREAALELTYLANDGGIVVPLSSAHLRETAALSGDRRYEVGIAMASLSAGWQLRHPNHVWRNEVTRMLAAELGLAVPSSSELPVVTLEPHAFLDDDVRAYEMAPDGTELFVLTHGAPSVVLELLIDPKPAPRVQNLTWVRRQQLLSKQLEESGLSREQKRSSAYSMLWLDNVEPVHAALTELGVSVSALAHLEARDIPRLFSSTPMLRNFSRLMTQRLIDISTHWRENDLTDLMFLATGTGYADYVAAEKHTGTQLRQAQESRREKITVFTSLHDLVSAIRTDGVTTVGERSEDEE